MKSETSRNSRSRISNRVGCSNFLLRVAARRFAQRERRIAIALLGESSCILSAIPPPFLALPARPHWRAASPWRPVRLVRGRRSFPRSARSPPARPLVRPARLRGDPSPRVCLAVAERSLRSVPRVGRPLRKEQEHFFFLVATAPRRPSEALGVRGAGSKGQGEKRNRRRLKAGGRAGNCERSERERAAPKRGTHRNKRRRGAATDGGRATRKEWGGRWTEHDGGHGRQFASSFSPLPPTPADLFHPESSFAFSALFLPF